MSYYYCGKTYWCALNSCDVLMCIEKPIKCDTKQRLCLTRVPNFCLEIGYNRKFSADDETDQSRQKEKKIEWIFIDSRDGMVSAGQSQTQGSKLNLCLVSTLNAIYSL